MKRLRFRPRMSGWAAAAFACLATLIFTLAVPMAARAQTNLALNRPVTASTTQSGLTAESAVDGNLGTRWGSDWNDGEWIYVDLGSTQTLTEVRLNWEGAYASGYLVQGATSAPSGWQTLATVTGGDGGEDLVNISGSARYVRILSTQRATGWGISLWEFAVLGSGGPPPTATLLSLNKPANASSFEGGFVAANAFDGVPTTRWGSAFTDSEWVMVDLQATCDITRIVLDWETALGRDFKIQTSANETGPWTDIHSITGNTATQNDFTVSGSGRYVRMLGLLRNTPWGYSLFNFEVWGTTGGGPEIPPGTANVTLQIPYVEYLDILVSPAANDGTTHIITQNTDRTITLNWPSNTAVTFTKAFLTSTTGDIEFASSVYQGAAIQDQPLTTNVYPNQTVTVVYVEGPGGPGEPGGPITQDPYTAPAPPNPSGQFGLGSPGNNALLNSTRRPTLTWPAQGGATGYDVFVNISRSDYDYAQPGSLLDRYTLLGSVSTPSFTFATDLPDRWTYKWYVVAKFAGGATTRSDIRTFSLYLPTVETVADGINLINGRRDLNKNGSIQPYEDWALPISQRIDDLMSRMSKHEKAMQMFFNAQEFPNAGFAFGPFLPQDLQNYQKITALQAHGIPFIDAGDTVHGYATSYPTQIGLRATGNLPLIWELADMQRREHLAVGSRGTLSPNAEVGTTVLYPRTQEANGEDADFAAAIVRAMITGLQGGPEVSPDSIWVTLKHWPGQGAGGEDGITYDGTTLHYHMRPWHGAVEAGVSGIMPGYAGAPIFGGNPPRGAGDTPEILAYLRTVIGYQGAICTDWLPSGAWAGSANAGADIMGGANPGDINMGPDFEALVPDARMNEAVRRILDLKFRMGLFENPYGDPIGGQGEWNTAESKALVQQAARESMTLLKNTGILPLRLPGGSRLVVAGPRSEDGESFAIWRSAFHPEYGSKTFFQAIQERGAQAGYTVYKDNVPGGTGLPNAAIICVGERSYTHGTEWPTEQNYLSTDQLNLIQSWTSQGVPTIVVYIMPRPYVIATENNIASAILCTYRPGDQGGTALADVLFGDFAPKGRLPWQLPRNMAQVGAINSQVEREDLPYDLGATPAQREEIRSRIGAGLPILPIYGDPLFQANYGIQGYGLTDSTNPTGFATTAPANNATVTTLPTFSWNASSDPQTGIQRYDLYLDGVKVASTQQTSLVLTNVPVTNGAHSWYVRAVNWANGETQSNTANFTMQDNTAPAAFNLLRPRPASLVTGQPTLFTWEVTTDTGSGLNRYELLLNGAEVAEIPAAGTPQPSAANLALGAPAQATSVGFGTPQEAVDGNLNTRWGSIDAVDPQIFWVDLTEVHSITSVRLRWETAAALEYYIVAKDREEDPWTDVAHVTNGVSGEDRTIPITSGSGRFVGVRGVSRTTGYGYSLWEFEVFGKPTLTTAVSSVPNGNHTWTVRAIDNANNQQTPANSAFTKQ